MLTLPLQRSLRRTLLLAVVVIAITIIAAAMLYLVTEWLWLVLNPVRQWRLMH
jgi:hypothetical protein